MIYEYMLVKPMIDLENITEAESIDMINYLDESFLIIESASDRQLESAMSDLKDICNRIKNEKLSVEELKQELDELYDKIKIAIEAGGNPGTIAKFIGTLGLLAGAATIYAGSELNRITVMGAGFLSAVLGCLIGAAGSKKDSYDKVYDALIAFESKCMMMKRKAKKSEDVELEKKADKMIELIEDFKTKRRNEYKKVQESVVTESDKSEIKINNFKQATDEVNRTLTTAFKKMKISGDIMLKIFNKALAITPKNKDKTVNEIIDIGKGGNEGLSKEEILHPQLHDSLLTKWSKTFSAKYSPYGMEVRLAFEKKLAEFNNNVIDWINEFFDKMNKLVGLEKKGIPEISKQLYEKVRQNSSVSDADRINNICASWYNDGVNSYFKFIQGEIGWAKYILKTKKIQKSLRYKILSKFVK